MPDSKDSDGFEIFDAPWEKDAEAILSVREAVFIVEQGVSRDIEIDGSDEGCHHILARDRKGKPIGTARLDRGGHVGRVAVLAEWRGNGVGRVLMDCILGIAIRRGFESVELNSQTHAAGFYEKLGFERVGPEFEEAGIPHVTMVTALDSSVHT